MGIIKEKRRSIFQERRLIDEDTENIVLLDCFGRNHVCSDSVTEMIREMDAAEAMLFRMLAILLIASLIGMYALGFILCDISETFRDDFGFLFGKWIGVL